MQDQVFGTSKKPNNMNRKHFFRAAITSSSVLMGAPFLFARQSRDDADPLPAEKVKEFVTAGHSNLGKVKDLLVEFPTLVYATWDWGGGDFETAIEGAGHVGNKEIANYLVEQGARTNLFVLTMLGKTAIVKSFLDAYPQYINAKGPHGFTLLHHAQRGGDASAELLDYVMGKGLKETRIAL